MARVRLNPIIERLRGAIGDIVFRNRHGQTYVSRMPDFSGVEPSEAQQAQRERFREATHYGTASLSDPEAIAHYAPLAEQQRLTVYNAMVADFLVPPVVSAIDVSSYTGSPGDVVRVTARNDYGVTRVVVSITELDGSEIEQGEAVLDGHRWVFTAQTDLEATPAVVVEATAHDRPGNATTDSVEVNLAV